MYFGKCGKEFRCQRVVDSTGETTATLGFASKLRGSQYLHHHLPQTLPRQSLLTSPAFAGDVAAGLGFIVGADIPESARGGAATVDARKHAPPVADPAASGGATASVVCAKCVHLDTMH